MSDLWETLSLSAVIFWNFTLRNVLENHLMTGQASQGSSDNGKKTLHQTLSSDIDLDFLS